MITKRVMLLSSILVLISACAVDVISPEDPTKFIPDRTAELKVGKMDRSEVRAILGKPHLSSADWGFDLFRADAQQSNMVVAVTPWPIPFASIKDQIHRYTLVSYDPPGISSATATGLVRRPAAWRNTSPIKSDWPSLHLRIGELMFFVDPEGARDISLLVAPAGRDAHFQRLSRSKRCTVVVGCGDQGCGDQLAVDGGKADRLPVRTAQRYWLKAAEREAWLRGIELHDGQPGAGWLEALVSTRLPAGQHVLEFSSRYLGGRHSISLACRPGDVRYLVVNASDNKRFIDHALVNWQIEQSEAMPARFSRRPLVIVDDGRWYVDAEPDD